MKKTHILSNCFIGKRKLELHIMSCGVKIGRKRAKLFQMNLFSSPTASPSTAMRTWWMLGTWPSCSARPSCPRRTLWTRWPVRRTWMRSSKRSSWTTTTSSPTPRSCPGPFMRSVWLETSTGENDNRQNELFHQSLIRFILFLISWCYYDSSASFSCFHLSSGLTVWILTFPHETHSAWQTNVNKCV